MDIKPIETVYNGYRFRSRLEARWAVFFDAAGIKYQYEPEGFEFGDGIKYLPDFYLPDFKIHVEIKPSRELDDGKAEKFAFSMITGGVLVCYGDPMNRNLRFITGHECDWGGGGCFDSDWGDIVVAFTEHLDGSGPCLYVDYGKGEADFYKASRVYTEYTGCGVLDDINNQYSDIRKAEVKARQARFEHDETPQIRRVSYGA